MDQTIKESVFEALNNLLENEYELEETDEQQAIDLATYCPELDNMEYEVLIPYVAEFREYLKKNLNG